MERRTFIHIGGLACLGEGCYSYWDKMGDGLRFGSLLVALTVVVALGCWKFRPMELVHE